MRDRAPPSPSRGPARRSSSATAASSASGSRSRSSVRRLRQGPRHDELPPEEPPGAASGSAWPTPASRARPVRRRRRRRTRPRGFEPSVAPRPPRCSGEQPAELQRASSRDRSPSARRRRAGRGPRRARVAAPRSASTSASKFGAAPPRHGGRAVEEVPPARPRRSAARDAEREHRVEEPVLHVRRGREGEFAVALRREARSARRWRRRCWRCTPRARSSRVDPSGTRAPESVVAARPSTSSARGFTTRGIRASRAEARVAALADATKDASVGPARRERSGGRRPPPRSDRRARRPARAIVTGAASGGTPPEFVRAVARATRRDHAAWRRRHRARGAGRARSGGSQTASAAGARRVADVVPGLQHGARARVAAATLASARGSAICLKKKGPSGVSRSASAAGSRPR